MNQSQTLTQTETVHQLPSARSQKSHSQMSNKTSNQANQQAPLPMSIQAQPNTTCIQKQESITNQNTTSTSFRQAMKKRQYCKIHLDKPIEYFCQQCFQTVCSKCMFHHHNGHELSQLDDALKILLSKIQRFDHKVKESVKEHEELKNQLTAHKNEIDSLKQKQTEIIEARFSELMAKLEERKIILSKEVMNKYDQALFKVNDRIRQSKDQEDQIMGIEKLYEDILKRLQNEEMLSGEGTQEQIEILNQVPEYDKIIYESTLKIKNFQLSQKNTKLEIQGGEIIGLRPVEVTLENAYNLIQTIQFDNLAALAGQMSMFLQKKNSSHDFNKVMTPSNASQPPIIAFPSLKQDEIVAPSKMDLVSKGPSPINVNTSFSFPLNRVNQERTNSGNSAAPGIPPLPQFSSSQSGAKPQSIFANKNPNSHSNENRTKQIGIQPLLYKPNEFDYQPMDDAMVPHQLNDSKSDASQYASKFARLKFNRLGTNHSQELCLQFENQQPEFANQQNSIEQTQHLQIPQIDLEQSPYEIIQDENNQIVLDEEDQQELASQKIKPLDHALYFIGDRRFMLMFDPKSQQWNQLYFNRQESDYQGTLKFMSICQISLKKREFIMTGGCNKVNKEPSQQCFRFNIQGIRQFREVAGLNQGRYGHTSVFVNSMVMVLGGFNHRDDEAQAPNTLNSCEKYSLKENTWSPIASMQQERAYFSACRVKEEFIYVFGGFQNYDTSNTIEFYNVMLDKWTMLSVFMPIKIAKYGLAKIEENQIMIAGGLLVDSGNGKAENASYQCVNTVYKFDCNSLKWTKLAKLNFRRTLYSTMAVKDNGLIYAIGGTVEGINEVYDLRKKKWATCQSYTSVMGQNDLQTYALCSISKIDE